MLEANDKQVIFAKAGDDSRPSVPTLPGTGRGQPNNFPSSQAPARNNKPMYVPKYRTPPKIDPGPGLGAGAGPGGGAGGGNRATEFDFDDNKPSAKKEQQRDYDYRSNNKKKKVDEDQCPIDEQTLDEQNKAGIDELPDSSQFIYRLETKAAKKAIKNIWRNPEAKKEVLAGLNKMSNGELLPRNQKDFKGFKTLKEIKLTETRMLVQPGKNGGPDQIVAIFMRRDIHHMASTFRNIYK